MCMCIVFCISAGGISRRNPPLVKFQQQKAVLNLALSWLFFFSLPAVSRSLRWKKQLTVLT